MKICQNCDNTGIIYAANGMDDSEKAYCFCPMGEIAEGYDRRDNAVFEKHIRFVAYLKTV